MASVKILSITVRADVLPAGMPAQYILGAQPVAVEGGPVVEKIIYHRHAYNGGLQGDFSCYAIHLSDNTRRLVPVNAAALVDVAKGEDKQKADDVPELPE